MKYAICKNSRVLDGVSYSGPTWDAAKIRPLYRPQYTEKVLAETLARLLTKHNSVGFHVVEVSGTPPVAPR